MPLLISSVARRTTLLTAVLCLSLVTAACGKGDDKKAPSQVAVKVNGEEVSVHQVDLMLRRQAANVPAGQQDAAARRVIEALVDQELTAQAARKDKLDQDPRVVQMMEAAKRDVLARVYLERLSDKVTEPSSDEIDRYYDSHPNLFSQRRLYSLQETTVALPADNVAALKAKLEATTSVDKLNEVLRAESVRFSSRQTSISAEDVPLGLLDQLAALKEGQSIMQVREGAGRVLTLISAQLSPIAPAPAKRLIASYLINDRKRTTLQHGVKALREQAKIEYQGRYAELVNAAASAPAAPAEAPPAASAP
ncbi:EpsD family peptidyl-prolyl cis-trans isomerase [Rhizobacter sp. Root1221]|uniref:EpsD family peptidyl-prolyl cis-trans isomerase n=1 Tax=Rhizobacter sp. Root1221 TaxID=1736433 RepID=UPI0006F8E12E|nr:EpsD family peptidyl-prolyl cis-trans isomerase [Rhizobacter sp. Root1221]KQV91569.1 hypothetical protein ASC87_05605 [Rhizobacter sp. Root1221]